jgi:hypothetical protein
MVSKMGVTQEYQELAKIAPRSFLNKECILFGQAYRLYKSCVINSSTASIVEGARIGALCAIHSSMMSHLVHFTVEKCLRLLPALTAILVSLSSCAPLTAAQLAAVKGQNTATTSSSTAAATAAAPVSFFNLSSTVSPTFHFTVLQVSNSYTILVDQYQGTAVSKQITINSSDSTGLYAELNSIFQDSSHIGSFSLAPNYSLTLSLTSGKSTTLSQPWIDGSTSVQFSTLTQYVFNHL